MRLVLFATLAVVGLSWPVGACAQQLAVISRTEDVMAFYDLKSGAEIDRVPIGRFCHETAADSAYSKILTASYRGNTIHVVDARTRESRTFEIAGYSHFHGVEMSRSGDLLWVTAEDSGVVLELNSTNGDILAARPTRGDRSHMVKATGDGKTLYVANMNSASVSIIDRTEGTTSVVTTGPGSEGIDISPDGLEVWLASRGDTSLSVISAASGERVDRLHSGAYPPVKLEISPDGNSVWVSNHMDGNVTVFDRAKRELIATIDSGDRPLSITFSADGSRVYVSRPPANEVIEIDAATFTILRHIPTAENPDGMLWIPGD